MPRSAAMASCVLLLWREFCAGVRALGADEEDRVIAKAMFAARHARRFADEPLHRASRGREHAPLMRKRHDTNKPRAALCERDMLQSLQNESQVRLIARRSAGTCFCRLCTLQEREMRAVDSWRAVECVDFKPAVIRDARQS